MAYTKAPTQDTYSSVKIPAVWDISIPQNEWVYSSGNAGSYMINMIPVKQKTAGGEEELVAEFRSSYAARTVATTADKPRGCYVWEKTVGTVYYFVVAGTNVYTSTNLTVWTAVNVLAGPASADDPVGFVEFIDSTTNTKTLVLVDGINGYVFTTNAAGTLIVDVDFPTPHVPTPVFIDGYLFLAKKNTGDIYNSDLNTPSAWTAGNFISSELYPDDIQSLVKINNYLLAIGTTGCEYFYDAGNSTGSPLARQEGASLPFGTTFPRAVATNLNMAVILARTGDGELTFRIIEDFKYKDFSPVWLLRAIQQLNGAGILSNTNLISYFMRMAGKLYLVFRCTSANGVISAAYDFALDTWIMLNLWDSTAYPTVPYDCWPICSGGTYSRNSGTFLAGNKGTALIFGSLSSAGFLGTTGPALDFHGSDRYPINIAIKTLPMSFGTLNRKFMHRLGVVYEQPNGVGELVGLALGNLPIFWSDNNGQTYSSSSITFDYSSANLANGNNYNFPFVTQLGSFRQRTFKIETSFATGVTQAMPFKLKYFEVDINKGQQ